MACRAGSSSERWLADEVLPTIASLAESQFAGIDLLQFL